MRVVLGGTDSVRRLSDMNGLPLAGSLCAISALSKLLSAETVALSGATSSSKNDLKSLPLLMKGMRCKFSSYSANLCLTFLSYSLAKSIPDTNN